MSDEAYTNVAARTVLEDASATAKVVGASAAPRWSKVAAGLVVPVEEKLGIHPEFGGYGGQLVKQADVTLMQCPWRFPMPKSVAEADLDYYVPRSDPEGPSMTDTVSMIYTAAFAVSGCSSYVFTRRSYEPFIKDSFGQFSKTRTGGAFTFMTGIGGFLQEFLYGYSGLRWEPNSVALDPSLTSQRRGVVLHQLHWRGRTFDVKVGQRQTTVTLDSGAPLPVKAGGQIHKVRAGAALTIPLHGATPSPARPSAEARPGRPRRAERPPAGEADDAPPRHRLRPRRVPRRRQLAAPRRRQEPRQANRRPPPLPADQRQVPPPQGDGRHPRRTAAARGTRNLRPAAPKRGRPDLGSVLHLEAELQRHLVMGDAAVVAKVAADLGHLEPVEVPQRLAGSGQRVLDRLLDAVGRRPDDLADGIDIAAHYRSSR
ncbi:MAG TPA: glycosyl hydrolase family 65 protein [Solirubrobacterales bacterium]